MLVGQKLVHLVNGTKRFVDTLRRQRMLLHLAILADCHFPHLLTARVDCVVESFWGIKIFTDEDDITSNGMAR